MNSFEEGDDINISEKTTKDERNVETPIDEITESLEQEENPSLYSSFLEIDR